MVRRELLVLRLLAARLGRQNHRLDRLAHRRDFARHEPSARVHLLLDDADLGDRLLTRLRWCTGRRLGCRRGGLDRRHRHRLGRGRRGNSLHHSRSQHRRCLHRLNGRPATAHRLGAGNADRSVRRGSSPVDLLGPRRLIARSARSKRGQAQRIRVIIT
eukprot:3969301-Prymnesium_polylepis.1